MTRWEVLNKLIERYGYRRYLEIGVGSGECLVRVKARCKVGVEPTPSRELLDLLGTDLLGTEIIFSRSDECWSRLSGRQFNLVFIDGWHEHQQVLSDVDGAMVLLAPAGTIVLHDCNPPEEKHQTVPASDPAWYGDVWKAVVELRQRSNLLVYVVDADCGLGIIQVAGPVITRAELTWDNFVAHRREWLGLVGVEEFLKCV